ncbi:hypothetical protein TNCV_190061 [Trichonephila clavipes]|nr:hypothetical protein TNCV_190061 [Trichonephila clavipes]
MCLSCGFCHISDNASSCYSFGLRDEEPEEEKGVAGTPHDLCHIGEKVGQLPTPPIGQLAHLPIRGPFPRPGNIISVRISCSVSITV